MYSSYTAASFARKHDLADRHGVNLEGALTWAFEFEDQPFFAGFRALATNGINKPVLNVFRMFSKMRGQRLAADSDGAVSLDEMMRRRGGVREKPDVSALASIEGNTLSVMAWHYHDDDLPGPDADVSLLLGRLPEQAGQATVSHYRIDETHSNAYTLWQRMGRPETPNPEQYADLEKASELALLASPSTEPVQEGQLMLRFSLPRQAVSLLVVTWGRRG